MGRLKQRVEQAFTNARQALLAEYDKAGFWRGKLSSSALATAIAVVALEKAGRVAIAERGKVWIRAYQNADGGWGDSPESPSNFTATLLVQCALGECNRTSSELINKVLSFYGKDRTFSVPVLTMCRISGAIDRWEDVPPLPFELAAIPHQFYKWVRLPVVSYALPALIAIGLVRHHYAPSIFPWVRWLRDSLTSNVLSILEAMQPECGGFLAAAPLTSFVAMSLYEAGFEDHPVTQKCIQFLEDTVRQDGSWPIDVDLSTWLTSLSVCALSDQLSKEMQNAIRSHLLKQQWTVEHPFTHAAAGGWGWSNQSGAVPDADDTAGALLALATLGRQHVPIQAIEMGIQWLLNLQNRDGGIPTFCRGWGRLPFDQSCPDITAHALRAWEVWYDLLPQPLQWNVEKAKQRALCYLEREQREDGSWVPLWFGRQGAYLNENPVYGAACVLPALPSERMKERGLNFLRAATPVDLEELALQCELSDQGIESLLALTEEGTIFPASPMGLYFASLWYSEKLYPMIFTVRALRHCLDRLK